ncbi:isopeptide-forming domain-containing fimbrial protein [uncultured Ruminococcus sp.]|uniref:isopeptide-forming domain-containing fimbrial protein n=1 Tax=uncultured Ruminococcus sp. TaxID=165186 RepID=UPI0034272B3C
MTSASTAEDYSKAIGKLGDRSDAANALARILDDVVTSPITDTNSAANIIGGAASGYYLVKETTEADEDNPITLNLLKVVGDDVTVTTKEDLPTLEKKITGATAKDDGKANAVSIGDAVPYEITSKVPDMTGYAKYFFVISDNMVEGLTFNNDVAITIGGTTVPAAKYEVQTGAAADGNTFQIVFKNFYGNWKNNAGDEIKVTYSATLNEHADRTTTGNLNTANLTYSNNPNIVPDGESPDNPDEPKPPTPDNPDEPGDPVGKTPDKQTKTYTANIKLTKVDGASTATPKATLTGAKFKLTGTAANVVLVNGTAYQKDAAGTFYKLKDGTFTTTAPDGNEKLYDGTDKYKEVTNVSSNTTYTDICMDAYVKSDGTLEFGGLGAGTYTITELVAPSGYNMLDAPIVVVISDTGVTFDAPAWTATKDGEDIDMNDTATVEFEIENKEGSTLPSTGGIGTKLFYIFGGILVAGSGVLLITKKRMAKDN